MSSNYEDQLQRQLRAFAAALARILGLKNAGAVEAARLALEESYQALLGDLHDVLRRVDSVTAASMLFIPARIAGYARLVRADAELTDDPGRAAPLLQRALELALEARLRGHDDPEFAAFMSELAGRCVVASLSLAHRELLTGSRAIEPAREQPRSDHFPLDRTDDA